MWDMLRWYEKRQRKPGNVDDGGRNTARELFRRSCSASTSRSTASSSTSRPPARAPTSAGGCCCCSVLRPAASRRWSSSSNGGSRSTAIPTRVPSTRLQARPCTKIPLNIVPASLRAQFRETYGVEIRRRTEPALARAAGAGVRGRLPAVPVERMFLSEATRVGVGTYAPHDPTTADIADLVGSVDLSKVGSVGDEGDPRAWSWSGAVYAASRGVLEMIEILKVKREFLYLLLTLDPGKERQGVALPAHPPRRDDPRAHEPRRVQQVPAGEGERGAARPHGHHARCRTRCPTTTRRASTRSSSPARPRSATCTSTRTCSSWPRCSRS